VVRFLYVDGVKRDVSHYPNDLSTWLDMDTAYSDRIVDSDITQPSGYWNGAEVVFHPQSSWELANVTLTQSHDTLILPSGSGVYKGDYYWSDYFFRNDTSCIDLNYEWSYDETNHYIYIKLPSDPSNYQIIVSSTDDLVTITNSDNLIFDGLDLQGGNRGFLTSYSDNMIIKNCNLKDFYISARMVYSYDCKFENNYINTAAGIGIEFCRMLRSYITDNKIYHIGDNYLYFDDTGGSNLEAVHIFYDWDGGEGNNIGSDSIVFKGNDIYSSGYCGIRVSQGNKIYITENKIVNYNNLKQDGGGIYFWECNAIEADGGFGNKYDSCYVAKNYVYFSADSSKCNDGVHVLPITSWGCYGIYTDDYCFKIRIDSNYFQGGRAGIFFHNDSIMWANGNKIFPEDITKAAIRMSDTGGSGGFQQDSLMLSGNEIYAYYDGSGTVSWLGYDTEGTNPTTMMHLSGNYWILMNTQYSSYDPDDVWYDYSTVGGSHVYTSTELAASDWSDGTDKGAPFKLSSTGLSTIDSMVVGYFNWSDTTYTFVPNTKYSNHYYYYDKDRVDKTSNSISLTPYTGSILLRSYNIQLPPDETAPDTVKSFTLSSPARDSIVLGLIGFASDVDSIRINYRIGTYPTSRTDGTLYAAFGVNDTTTYHSRRFYVDSPTDTTYYFRVWSGDVANNWTAIPNKRTVDVDSTGVVHAVYYESHFRDSTAWLYTNTYWQFIFDESDSAAIFNDAGTNPIYHSVTLPGNTSLKFTFTITDANTTARFAFTDNSENVIVAYDDYANGTHTVTGTTDTNGSTRVVIYGSSGSPNRWRMTYLKIETNN
jgi:hypothetical protein